jgi:hypothetical protein
VSSEREWIALTDKSAGNGLRALDAQNRAQQAQADGHQKYLYFARIEHPNEVVYAENVLDYCSAVGIPARQIVMKSNGADRSELEKCLSDAITVVSTNWHLDHSCLGDRHFMDIAAEAAVPVVQWILDHPSARWPEFRHTTADNSRFVFLSPYSEAYFRKYIFPACRSAWTAGTGPNQKSRVAGITRASYLRRDTLCLVPLNLRRLDATLEEIEGAPASLPYYLQRPVREAIELAYCDLQAPIEGHLLSTGLDARILEESGMLHRCIQIIEDAVQVRRRLKVFQVARKFPALLQSDVASRYLDSGLATLEEGVSITETLGRMRRAKSVISLAHVNDELHDRVLNGLNAGVVNIIEDNKIHREIFRHGENALFFRYDDDSLREALDLVFSVPSRAFQIAEAGFALRDDPRLRFGGFSNFLPYNKPHLFGSLGSEVVRAPLNQLI